MISFRFHQNLIFKVVVKKLCYMKSINLPPRDFSWPFWGSKQSLSIRDESFWIYVFAFYDVNAVLEKIVTQRRSSTQFFIFSSFYLSSCEFCVYKLMLSNTHFTLSRLSFWKWFFLCTISAYLRFASFSICVLWVSMYFFKGIHLMIKWTRKVGHFYLLSSLVNEQMFANWSSSFLLWMDSF